MIDPCNSHAVLDPMPTGVHFALDVERSCIVGPTQIGFKKRSTMVRGPPFSRIIR